MKWLLTILLLVCFCTVNAQEVEKTIQQGNEYYRQKQFANAAEEYNKAIRQDPDNATAKLNLASALQKQGQEVEADRIFTEVATSKANEEIKAKAWYNKGVILSKQKRLEESIEAYKNALRLDPSDNEARENLQKAILELKKKEPPKKDDQQKKKKEEDQKKKQQQQPKMDPKEAEQRLKLLEQKEKEVQEKVQKNKSKGAGSQVKDW